MKNGNGGSDRPRTARTPAERGYGWLAAVLPADARRFRVADTALAATLSDAGADLVASAPDVEIAPVAELRGDAAVSISLLGRPARDRPLLVRVARRLANSGRVRLEARRTKRTVARLGHPTVTVITWDYQRTLRDPSAPGARSWFDLREYFPQRALVVGRARPHESLLDSVLGDASEAAGRALQANSVMIRSGLLIIDTNEGMLRVAVGAGSLQIRNQRAALATLDSSECPPIVADRIPWLIATGRSGLAEWSLERRLPGTRARPPVRGPLLAECLDFLTALYSSCLSAPHRGSFNEQAEVVASVCAPEEARVARALGERLETVLADVPRGFGHGDFFHGNLLVEGGRLVGVADWDSGGPGRLPLIDLLHLRHTSTRELTDIDWGPLLVRELLPWARAGRDDAIRTYCRRIGFEADGERLEALAMAYWLDCVSYWLRNNKHSLREPRWPERNISLVLDAVHSLPWIA